MADIINTTGVALILAAFFLNTLNIFTTKNILYFLMNVIGSGLACYGSYLIDAIPFIVLEGCWALIALLGIARILLNRTQTTG